MGSSRPLSFSSRWCGVGSLLESPSDPLSPSQIAHGCLQHRKAGMSALPVLVAWPRRENRFGRTRSEGICFLRPEALVLFQPLGRHNGPCHSRPLTAEPFLMLPNCFYSVHQCARSYSYVMNVGMGWDFGFSAKCS